MDRLLSKDWTYDEWIERYTFVNPSDVLKKFVSMDSVYAKYKKEENKIDYINFMNEIFSMSSTGAYINAFRCAGIKYYDPYAYMKMAEPLNLQRVRYHLIYNVYVLVIVNICYVSYLRKGILGWKYQKK